MHVDALKNEELSYVVLTQIAMILMRFLPAGRRNIFSISAKGSHLFFTEKNTILSLLHSLTKSIFTFVFTQNVKHVSNNFSNESLLKHSKVRG